MAHAIPETLREKAIFTFCSDDCPAADPSGNINGLACASSPEGPAVGHGRCEEKKILAERIKFYIRRKYFMLYL